MLDFVFKLHLTFRFAIWNSCLHSQFFHDLPHSYLRLSNLYLFLIMFKLKKGEQQSEFWDFTVFLYCSINVMSRDTAIYWMIYQITLRHSSIDNSWEFINFVTFKVQAQFYESECGAWKSFVVAVVHTVNRSVSISIVQNCATTTIKKTCAETHVQGNFI